MKLKTLKEILYGKITEVIEPSLFDHGNTKKKTITREKYDQDNCGYSWNISEVGNELRQEAIKWIKKIEKAEENKQGNMPYVEGIAIGCDEFSCDNVKDWIINFFNITEEELSANNDLHNKK